MDPRQKRLGTILALVLSALVAWLVLVDAPGEESDAEDYEDAVSIRPEEVVALTLENSSGSLRAERDGSGWRIVEPRALPADVDALDGVIDVIDRLALGPVLDSQEAAAFGLDPPKAVLELDRSDGSSFRVALGRTAPVGYRSYVRVDGGPIRLARGHLGDSLEVGVDGFRQRRLLRLAESAVRELSWAQGDLAWAARLEGGLWWLDEGSPADGAELDALVATLAEAELHGFAEPPGTQPAWALGVIHGDEESELAAFSADEGGWIVASTPGVSGLLEDADALLRTPDQLRSSRLTTLRPGEVKTIEIDLDGRSARWTREDSGWTEAGTAAPPEAVERIERLLVTSELQWRAGATAEARPRGRLVLLGDPARQELELGDLADGGLGILWPAGALVLDEAAAETLDLLTHGVEPARTEP